MPSSEHQQHSGCRQTHSTARAIDLTPKQMMVTVRPKTVHCTSIPRNKKPPMTVGLGDRKPDHQPRSGVAPNRKTMGVEMRRKGKAIYHGKQDRKGGGHGVGGLAHRPYQGGVFRPGQNQKSVTGPGDQGPVGNGEPRA